MNTISLLRSLMLALLAAATQVHAQRETFDASTIRIIESKTIENKLARPVPGKTIERRGVDIHGKIVIIFATQLAFTFDDVFFKFDSTELRNKSSEEQLCEMLTALKSGALKDRQFLIEGHTCDIGSEGYNYKLSASRAQAIKNYLVAHGIPPERLAVLGCGKTDPAVKIDLKGTPVEIEARHSRNRRVVLRELPPPPSSTKRKK